MLDGNPPISQYLTNQVLTAARQWTFEPAQVNGKTVPSTTTIVFSFRPSSE